MAQLTRSFLAIAERFKRSGGDSTAIDAAMTEGSRLLRRSHEAGLLEFSIEGIVWPDDAPRTVHDKAAASLGYAALWIVLVEHLERLNPGKFPLNTNQFVPHTEMLSVGRGRDNQARAENYAVVCELLAQHCEQQDIGSASRDVERTTPEAANESSWPVGTGWEFEPGRAAFRGEPFAITGKPVVILKRLAEKPGEPVLKRILRDIIDPDSNAEEGCVRDSINEARAILRKAFKLGNTVDPIPNLARGPDAAWKLDENVFRIATKNPR